MPRTATGSPEVTRRRDWLFYACSVAKYRDLPMPCWYVRFTLACMTLFHHGDEFTVREQLLRGLLGSDLLGFQTHNYARHFRQTCSRILSLEALPKGIQVDHSFVDVAVFPIGIDVQDLTQKRCVNRGLSSFVIAYYVRKSRNPEVAEWAKSIRQRYEGKKLIVGRDKLDEVSVGAGFCRFAEFNVC